MSYTALYRKFRPLTFGEMVGQEPVTRTLRNQIVAGRVGHAYLLSGGRGTGKTSTAKILARAINCLNPKDGEPCNECEICKGILSGGLTDVVEMDAASNNSVEDIRSIREEVNFMPTLAKYRIYIIDEVHMLSAGAFNALLKTLEEPPLHVKFILATTEPQKLPATILSRCQRFDFKRIPNKDIIKRLEIICKESKIEITKEALNIIAVLSEGAMRDAISILERCIQDGDNKIEENKIKELAGIPKLTYIYKIAKAILEYSVEDANKAVEEVIEDGKDLNNFLWEIIKYFKDIILIKTSGDLEIYSKEEKEQIKELSEKASKERLLKLIYSLSELENEIKWSTQKLIIFQVGIMKACQKTENQGIEELENRINELEKQIKAGVKIKPEEKVVQMKEPTKTEEPRIVINTEPEEETKNVEELVSRCPKKINPDNYLKNWANVTNNLKQNGKIVLYTNLLNTKAFEINDMTVGIEFERGLSSISKTILEKPENMQELVKMVSKECGKEMRIKYLSNEELDKLEVLPQKSFDDITNELNIPINIIEE